MLPGWDRLQDLRRGGAKADDPPKTIEQAVTSAPAIAAAADKVTTAKVLMRMSNDIREGKMPPLIEIKGLGAAVADIKKQIGDAKSEAAGLSIDGAKLVTAIKDIRAQVNQHFDDIKFEAEQLGNGS